MDRETWAAVRETFEEALTRPVADRAAYLAQACGSDPALRREVERLLDEATDMGDFLEAPPAADVSAAMTSDVGPGERVGAYRIVRRIASGGMGTVYEAEQDNPRRRVALKVMHARLASETARARFRTETQLLARLQHEHIARIYEAGLRDEGDGELPWFALELVEDAATLLDFARQRQLSQAARIALVIQACDAVHHGHQNGVIHRDIKAGNLLVDGGGTLKVIDFGVARATDDDDALTRHTQAGELVGTLQTMSPEQLQGDPGAVDIRVDVYALGALLYELLCDHPPHALAGKSISEVARIISETEPPPPSQHARDVPRDLDWVVLKAMDKDRERRYASASELAADLRRQQAHEPVLASPPSTAYRVAKFVRRHRLGVAATATIAVLLVGAVVGSSMALVEIADQRDLALSAQALAEREADKADTVVAFMIDLFETSDPSLYGPEVRVIDALSDAGERASQTFVRQPEVEESLHYVLGKLFTNVGELERAEVHLERAVALREAEHGVDDPRSVEARLALANLWLLTGRLDAADGVLTADVGMLVDGEGEPDRQALHAAASLATLRHRQARYAEAEDLYWQAIEAHRRVLGEDDELTLSVRANLGALFQELGRLDEADAELTALLARLEAVLGADHPRTLANMANLATLRIQQQRLPEAADLMQRSTEGRRRLLRPEHPHLLGSLTNLASLRFFNGDLQAAEELYLEVLELRARHYPPDNPDTVIVHCNLANVLYFRQDSEGLAALIDELVALDLGATADRRVAASVDKLIAALESWQEREHAASLLVPLLAAHQRLLPPDSPELARTQTRLNAAQAP